MHWSCLSVVFLLLRGSVAHEQQGVTNDDENNHLVTITPETFDVALAVSKLEPLLVMFHVGWCGVCKRTLPAYRSSAALVKELGLRATIAHADCTNDKTLVRRLDIESYPTIRMFAYGREFEYKDARRAESFVAYVKRLVRPAVNVISNWTSEFAETQMGGIFLQEEETDVFREVALEMRDQHLFAVKHMPPGISPGDATVVIANQPQTLLPARRSLGPAALFTKQLAMKNRFPGIWVADDKLFYALTHANIPAVTVVVDLKNPASFEQVKEQLAELEKSGRMDCIFQVIDGKGWDGQLENFGIYSDPLPRVIIFHSNMTFWIEDQEDLTVDRLIAADDIESLMAEFYSQSKSLVNFFFLKWRWLRNKLRILFPKTQAHYLAVAFGATLVLAVAYYTVYFCVNVIGTLGEDSKLD